MKTVKTVKTVEKVVSVCSWLILMVFVLSSKAEAATATPLAGLEFQTIITIPTWTSGAPKFPAGTQTSTDVFSFDPATHTLYFADRTNKGVSAIDTKTNTYIGTIVVPGCAGLNAAGQGSCPSGVLVAPNLHKLVITDRLNGGGANLQDLNHIFIFDLRLGQFTPPTGLTMPAGLDSDELDYDPLNHRAYVANTKAPYFLTVVDLVNNAIVDQIPLFSNPEQPRFNPVDGFVYITIPDDDNANAGAAVLKIDPTKSGAAAVVATFKTPGCPGHGIDIDPVTNTALLGCGNPDTPQALFDLTKGTILTTFPGVNGTDTEYFNFNVSRWYTASSNNTNSGVQCPQDTTDAFPVVGVFAAATKKNQIATIVGAECSGRNGHGLGINPFDNNIYVGARQFPADHGDPNTGQPGVLVFHDPADLAQTLEAAEEAQANVNPLPGFRSKAKVRSESTHISANVNELPLGTNEALLNITTTVGNEVVNCALGGPDEATCKGTLHGDPLLGGEVILAADGTPVAKGRIRQGHDR